MKLEYSSYHLTFRHPFSLNKVERTGTNSVFVRISHDKYSGFGEATLPPYLKETQESVISFLKTIDLSSFSFNDSIDSILDSFSNTETNNSFAKCAVEEALFHLFQQQQKYTYPIVKENLKTTYTLGISTPELIEEKLKNATNFTHLKLKMDINSKEDYLYLIQEKNKKPICIDLNQGWELLPIEECVRLGNLFLTHHVEFIEQPFSIHQTEKLLLFKNQCKIPVIADESIQGLEDLNNWISRFDGVNIKLLKCGGIRNAKKMIPKLKKEKKIIVIGCMSESTCGVYHAAQLADSGNYIDLDGPYLINNDPFSGFKIQNDSCILNELKMKQDLNFRSQL